MLAPTRFFDAAFRRFALTSLLATATDFGVANALHRVSGSAFGPTLIGCVAGGMVAFLLGRSWTFPAQGGSVGRQLSRFLGVWATSALLNSAGVPALLVLVPYFPAAWLLIRAGVYLGWNYPLARWFVFQAQEQAVRVNAT